MTTTQLASKIYHICHLEGQFLLRSGQTSSHYFDKYRFESDPQLLKAIAQLAKSQIPQHIQVLAALEMGGIPIATAIALETGLPLVFVRKQAKSYGTQRLAEGLDVANKQLLIIEDVITTGGQVIQSTQDLRPLRHRPQPKQPPSPPSSQHPSHFHLHSGLSRKTSKIDP